MEADRIRLRGMSFYSYHGVMPEEKALGQKFIIDADLYCDLRRAGESDRVEDTISYAEVYQRIKTVVTEECYDLLEMLAARIAEQVLQEFPCQAIRVEVHKPQAPIPGIFEDVSIEIFRENKG